MSVPVRYSHRSSVAKSSVERFGVWIEKLLYVCETLDLKLLWFLLNHLPTRHNMTSNTLHTHWERCLILWLITVIHS